MEETYYIKKLIVGNIMKTLIIGMILFMTGVVVISINIGKMT